MGYLQEVYEVSKKVFNDNKVKQFLNESTERMETASNFVEELNLTEKSSVYIGYEVLSKQLEISLNLEDGLRSLDGIQMQQIQDFIKSRGNDYVEHEVVIFNNTLNGIEQEYRSEVKTKETYLEDEYENKLEDLLKVVVISEEDMLFGSLRYTEIIEVGRGNKSVKEGEFYVEPVYDREISGDFDIVAYFLSQHTWVKDTLKEDLKQKYETNPLSQSEDIYLVKELWKVVKTVSEFGKNIEGVRLTCELVGVEEDNLTLEVNIEGENSESVIGDEYGYSMYSEPSLLVEMKKLDIKHMDIKFNVKGSLNDKKGVFRNTNTTEELDTIKELKNGNILIK